jgi:hypothetical protein
MVDPVIIVELEKSADTLPSAGPALTTHTMRSWWCTLQGPVVDAQIGPGGSRLRHTVQLQLPDSAFEEDKPFTTPAGKRSLARRYRYFAEALASELKIDLGAVGQVAVFHPASYAEWVGVRQDLENLADGMILHLYRPTDMDPALGGLAGNAAAEESAIATTYELVDEVHRKRVAEGGLAMKMSIDLCVEGNRSCPSSLLCRHP